MKTWEKEQLWIGGIFLFWVVLFLPKFVFFDPLTDESMYHMGLQFSYFVKNMEGFFPLGAGTYLNPLSDWILGLFRFLLGYSGGYLCNILLWFFSAILTYFIAQHFGLNRKIAAIVAIVGLSSEHVHSLTYTYFADPLVNFWALFSLYFVLKYPKKLWQFSLLLGTAVALKLTSLFWFLPLTLFFIYSRWSLGMKKPMAIAKDGIQIFAISFSFFLIISWPSLWKAYQETGDPLWPMLRLFGILERGDIALTKDSNFGPQGLFHIPQWLFEGIPRGHRMTEMGRNAGRTFVFFISAIAWCALPRFWKRPHYSAAVFLLASFLLWALQAGVLRYALVFEYLALLPLVMIYEAYKMHQRRMGRYVAVGFVILLLGVSFDFTKQIDFGGRPSLGKQWSELIRNPAEVLSVLKYDPFEEDKTVEALTKSMGMATIFQCQANGSIIQKHVANRSKLYWMTVGDKRFFSSDLQPHFEQMLSKVNWDQPLWLARIPFMENTFCYEKLASLGLQIDPESEKTPILVRQMKNFHFVALQKVR